MKKTSENITLAISCAPVREGGGQATKRSGLLGSQGEASPSYTSYGRADNWGLVSASCFMNNIDNLNDMNKWVVKKVPYSYDVKAIVYNKKNFTGPVYGPVKKR